MRGPFPTLFVLFLFFVALVLSSAPNTVLMMPFKAESRVQVFPTMQATPYSFLDGSTVAIEFGYDQGYDKLILDYPGQYDIEGYFNSENGVLYIVGNAPISEFSVAIHSVIFTTTSTKLSPRRITFAYGRGVLYASLTEHFYKFIPSAKSVAWESAREDCQAMKYMGLNGYLATITSNDENVEVTGRATFTSWLGGSDKEQESTWRWMTGPESGTQFWQGGSMYAGGHPTDDGFSKWYRFQPDNGNGDMAHFLSIQPSSLPNVGYWDDKKDSVMGFVCEFGGNDTYDVDSKKGAFYGVTQLYFSCPLLNNEAECKNFHESGCTWSGGQCRSTGCKRHLTQKACSMAWECHWAIDGFVGVCAATLCSKYLDDTSCAADPTCTMRNVGGLHRCMPARCEDHQTACGCAEIDGCVWLNQRCAHSKGLTCDGADVVFLLDGSLEMSKPVSRFSSAFWGLTDIFERHEFVLTGDPAGVPNASSFGGRIALIQYGPKVLVTPLGTGSHGSLTGRTTELVEDVKWHQQSFQPTLPGRQIKDALTYALSVFKDSTAERRKVLVITAAGLISDHAAIAATKNDGILKALKDKGITLLGVAIQSATAITDNGARDAYISLSDFIDDHVTKLSVDEMGQGINNVCNLNAPTKHSLCDEYKTPNECGSNSVCGWDSAAAACEVSSCIQYCTSDDCSARPECRWNSPEQLCGQKCASLNQADCNDASAVCRWEGDSGTGICADIPCVSEPTEDGCIASHKTTCVYNPLEAVQCAPLTCTATDPNVCDGTTGCMWEDSVGRCLRNWCGEQTEQDKCLSIPECLWTDDPATCAMNKNCGKHQGNERVCSKISQCHWEVSKAPSGCAPGLCTYYNFDSATAQTNCDQNPKCRWKEHASIPASCQVKTCDDETTACGCNQMENCVWRNDQCKDNRFVQCPAIDLIFAVETTKAMSKQYQRHPDGFVGVVEAIRAWSLEAPFAASPDSTGFRMAFIQYGGRTAKRVPLDANGGNVTGSQDTWARHNNGLLDWVEDTFKTYAHGVGDSVAIKDALEVALETFQNSDGTDRMRIVLILGTSSITDGADSLNMAVKNLEDNGVHIFGAVLRQFSTITPEDQRAADFLRPIVSDPHHDHFTFTTLDTMKAQLLERFCDPSTGTGRALQISRDRTLPCHWLMTETECEVQGSCFWDATANKTCPEENQCPSLDCEALPDALAKKFHCNQCELIGGAIQCSHSRHAPPPHGLCRKSPCSTDHCDQDACNGDTSNCAWFGDKSRCDRVQCSSWNSRDSCNSDAACVWQDAGVGGAPEGKCRRSACGKWRSPVSCAADGPQGNANARMCTWHDETTPGLCLESRCLNLNKDSCGDAAYLHMCRWSSADTKCVKRLCSYDTSAACESDVNCNWNPFLALDQTKPACQIVEPGCRVSTYSNWTKCTATCGSGGIRFKARSVIQAPLPGGEACSAVAAQGCTYDEKAPKSNCDPGDKTMIITQECTFSTPCDTHCKSINSVISCVEDISCEWKERNCQPVENVGCPTLTDVECGMSELCRWDRHLKFCVDAVTVCREKTAEACNRLGNCWWRTGEDANKLAAHWGTKVQLVNPGQRKVFVFPGFAIEEDHRIIDGATVTIEGNYQRDRDWLAVAYPTKTISSEWVLRSGTLKLSGYATVEEYAQVISFVTFQTFSSRTEPRKITWSFGRDTVFSMISSHFYHYVRQEGVQWGEAVLACEQDSYFGLQGYLATITSEEENAIVSTALGAEGWVSGDDATAGVWKMSTGPEKARPFWSGGSIITGGSPLNDGYSNWYDLAGQPDSSAGAGNCHVYLNASGFWFAQGSALPTARGYVCEYGGMTRDMPATMPTSGSTIIGIGGCVPHLCLWHQNASTCSQDVECFWSETSSKCVPGCFTRSSHQDCVATEQCTWDPLVVPPVCDINPCLGLGMAACALVPQRRCLWDTHAMCQVRTGCAIYTTQDDCDLIPSCAWSPSTEVCDERQCDTISVRRVCEGVPQCHYDDTMQLCKATLCRYGVRNSCEGDLQCKWNAVELAAPFLPGGIPTKVLMNKAEPPNDMFTMVDGITVTIVEGLQQGQDVLAVAPGSNAARDYKVVYDASTGVLTMQTTAGASINAFYAFQFMAQSVQFSSTSNSLAKRRVSYALGMNSIFDPEAKIFFQYVPLLFKTFDEARNFCAKRKFFGVTGSLANVQTATQNMLLVALGAEGWIGAAADEENIWRWLSPGSSDISTGVTFWEGVGALGKPKTGNFAQWATGEPKIVNKKGYAYFAKNGKWRVVFDNQIPLPPRGVICSFPQEGKLLAASNVISAAPQGCFAKPCRNLPEAQCKIDTQCLWVAKPDGTASCEEEKSCSPMTLPTNCSQRHRCFWEYNSGTCKIASPDFCSSQDKVACDNATQCSWNAELKVKGKGLGACTFAGCRKYPWVTTCLADPLCRWDYIPGGTSGTCISKLCGYLTEDQCWSDNLCGWDRTTASCGVSPCVGKEATAEACTTEQGCGLLDFHGKKTCLYVRCATTAGLASCHADSACLFGNGTCSMPDCRSGDPKVCNANPHCYMEFAPDKCRAAQCIVHKSLETCEQGVTQLAKKPCIWEGAKCRELTLYELNAIPPDFCFKEVENTDLIWILGAICLLLLLMIMYRLYLAYFKGYSLFEGKGKRKTFSPHEQYAAELFDDAKEMAGGDADGQEDRPLMSGSGGGTHGYVPPAARMLVTEDDL